MNSTWLAHAACRDISTDAFFAEPPTPEAVARCANCPVTAACLADELLFVQSPHELHGYRAGMTAQQRRNHIAGDQLTAAHQDHLERVERVHRARRAGLTIGVIAETEGVHRRTVVRWLSDHERAAG